MGNKIARTTQVSASEYYLHDLPSSYNLVLVELLGRGRFFKSILCKHDEGLVLVKVYFKRGEPLDLREYERRLAQIRDIFQSVQHPHVWPFQFWLETDKAAYLLRQYFFSNLHDRLSTRPFLSLIEKKWLAFQLLCAVEQSHNKGVCHGDIKCENVLVTSWNWLYLADFASFKPTYIPDDDPSDFSFFFDTGGRRRCYLAPERFYDHGGESPVVPDAPLKPSMDIFSLGCVIAELFLEGQPLFELSQLLAYRRGQYDPCQCLEKIQDEGVQKMILHMIQLNPNARLSSQSYLQNYASSIFPSYFSPSLHKFFSYLVPLDSDARVAAIERAFHKIHAQMMSVRSSDDVIIDSSASPKLTDKEGFQNIKGATQGMLLARGDARSRSRKSTIAGQVQLVGDITSLLRNVEQINHSAHSDVTQKNATILSTNDSDTDCTRFSKQSRTLKNQPSNDLQGHKQKDFLFLRNIFKGELDSLMDAYDSQTDTYRMPSFPRSGDKNSCDGMVLIASLVCSCIRSVKQPQLRRAGLLLLKTTSLYTDDEDRLQHVLPYVIAMLSDPAAIVRCAALETLCDILTLVQDFPPSDAMIFPEYIFPMLSMLPDDPEESVRICYASNISKIALSSYRFLIQAETIAGGGPLGKPTIAQKSQPLIMESPSKQRGYRIDSQLMQLRRLLAEIVQELVMGPKQTPNVRRALMQDIGHLCYFFGQKHSNDFLLPILPAFLNDRDEQLQSAFYKHIIFFCYFVGQVSVEEYLLPYIEQALSDEMEVVIVNGLDCLSILCKSGFLRKRTLLGLIEKVFPLLCYPIYWVRRSAVTFIAASSKSLGPVDSHVYLSPVLLPFLDRVPTSLSSETSLLSCLKPPVSKVIYHQVLENARSSDMLERQRRIWYNSSTYSNQLETIEHTRKVSGEVKSNNISCKRESDLQSGKYANSTTLNASLPVVEDVAVRTGTSFQISGSMDIRDSVYLEKTQFSAFTSPQVTAANTSLCDVPTDGIPLYYVSLNKLASGIGPESSCQWNPKGVAASSMRLEPLDKPFGLSNSVPPKLVSSSFLNISTNIKQVQKQADVVSRDSEQSAFLTSKFQDITVYDALKGSSLNDASQSELSGLSTFARASSVPDIGWKPRGVLVAHLQEHKSSVNDVTVSNDHTFFVSASDDSTVKIWDTRKLEKDISFRSRLTYSLDGCRALCTAMLRGTAQVVVGASDGTIHLFSVNYISRGFGNVIEKYSGIADIQNRKIGEGAILSVLNCSSIDSSISQTVLFTTQRCGVHLWDTRANSDAWTFKAVPDEGYVSSLVMGQCGNWFVSGSSRGVLTLWDLRFLLPVNSWQYPMGCPVEKLCLLIPPLNSVSAMTRPLVYVAAGSNEVSLWNAENGSCHQVLRVASGEHEGESTHFSLATERPSRKQSSQFDGKRNINSKYRIDELNEPAPRLQGIRSLLPLPGGDLLTGCADLTIRYWDHTSPEHSYCVCGPLTKGVGNDGYYDIRSRFGVQIVQQEMNKRSTKLTQKTFLSTAATDSAGCHRDSVLSLASLKLSQRVLISSSRDGAIKVWK
ncbi:serine/threonine-protein kinase VPS15-like isoform X1 [Zingiber officinale]|uniref:serine/threonine-protein kinase VPS15-like isoform X1 n=1 Tax=Zingiber officinale TaxID=94328 RepID=UPI001C4C6937|nr:serine/threonine-protein kinase VPS15-like isoform X1 [Zingiber officinale]